MVADHGRYNARKMRLWFVCCALVAANAQEASLLDQVKARAGENLRRLPNYTCTETIDRFVDRGRFRRLHKAPVRLDVAYVGGQELYGLPGSGKIDEPDITKFVDRPIGNGQFALFVKSIFFAQGAQIGLPIETKLEGQQSFRFDYRIPLEFSGFRIQSAAGEAFVAYSGSFWVTRESLDLMRLIVSAQDLPPQIKIASDGQTIDYGSASIGGALFRLPVRSRWETRDAFGWFARNTTTFRNCHQFVGESVLKFGGPEPSPPPK